MGLLSRRLKRFTLATTLGAGLLGFGAATARAQEKPHIGGVVNAASYTTAMGQGALASIFGTNIGPSAPCRSSVLPFPTSMCETQVLVDGVPAPIIYAQADQINYQTPWRTGAAKVEVINKGVISDPFPIVLREQDNGVFWRENHLGAAQNARYENATAQSPIIIPSSDHPGPESFLLLYHQVLGRPIDGPTPEPGDIFRSLVHFQTPEVRFDIDGDGTEDILPGDYVKFSGARGMIIGQTNILPPQHTAPGAKAVRLCTGGTCAPPVTVHMARDMDYITGTIASPGTMSDNKERPLDAIIAQAGTNSTRVGPYGDFLLQAQGDVELKLRGEGWENHNDKIIADGPTNIGIIKGFPRVTYTDVKGDYNRDTRTWDLTTGNPTLFDMVHYMATNAVRPECKESIRTWDKSDKPIKVYLDTANQPYYDPYTTIRVQGNAPSNAISGTDIVWKELAASPSRGGPAFQRVDYNPIARGEHGINFYFSNDMGGYGGLTSTLPHQTGSCSQITSADIKIAQNVYDSGSLAVFGRHEFGHATGHGNAAHSPYDETMGAHGGPDSARDRDGRKMVEFLEHGFDLSKVGK